MGDSMSTIINATTTNGIVIQPDNSGSLVLQTNNGTTALTIDTAQRAAFVAGTAALPAITTTGDTNTGMFFPAADTIAFAEGGTEAMRINSSGIVTKPYQPAFRARQSGSADYSAGSTLSFQTVDFNIGNNYSTATNRFTAPVSGVYYFSALAFAPPNTFVFLNFRVNGTLSDRIEYYGSNGTYNQHCIAVLKYLNAGDYIDMTNPSGTVHLNGGGDQGSQFNGYLIG
jgi:hypothetical protein